MLRNIWQINKGLLQEIQTSGCLFLCFAKISPLIFEENLGVQALNKIWTEAKKKGYIDENCVLLNHNALANEFFALDVKYDDMHHKAEETIPENVLYVFGKFKYLYGHFVVLNKNKEVIFDPLLTSSAVTKGKLESMRWYYANENL